MSFGEKIKNLRESNEITQSFLAKKVEMTQRRISYIENDKYEPSLSDIRAFCLYFNVSADYLLSLPENLPYPKRNQIFL